MWWKVYREFFRTKNVVGYGLGKKEVNGRKTDDPALVFTVSKKIPQKLLSKKDIIPQEVNGYKTDVIEVGELTFLDMDRTAKYRPFPMGVSVGHKDITAGTPGALVIKDNMIMLLSNNHVLANVNQGKVGDAILQPGPCDSENIQDDEVGALYEYIPIEFEENECKYAGAVVSVLNMIAAAMGSRVRLSYCRSQDKAVANKVDCALALLDKDVAVSTLAELGEIVKTMEVKAGDTVKKSGRTTGVTSGNVAMTTYTCMIKMSQSKSALFTDQILIDTPGFSAGGDSGSAIVIPNEDGKHALTGLLFAGSNKVTICNKIKNVTDELDCTIICEN